MSLFEPKYLFIDDNFTSKDYTLARTAVRNGAKRLPNKPEHVLRVGTENFPGKIVRDMRRARAVATRLVKEKPFGTDIRIREFRQTGTLVDQVRFRKTKAAKLADTPGNVYLDRTEGAIRANFPNARWAGDCVCKPNSDHAKCRAVDYFDSEANMIKARDIILKNKDYFNYTYVILFDRIWFGPGDSLPYNGVYHSHYHISVGGEDHSAC